MARMELGVDLSSLKGAQAMMSFTSKGLGFPHEAGILLMGTLCTLGMFIWKP